jgi:hypothetical protein
MEVRCSGGKKLRGPAVDRYIGGGLPGGVIPTMALRAGAYVVHINPVQVAQPSSREFCLVGRATEIVPALVSLIGLPSDDQYEDQCREAITGLLFRRPIPTDIMKYAA